MENLLDDFAAYIQGLCAKHVDIKHTEEESHFVVLHSDSQLQGKNQTYPLVTLDKLEISYTGPEDATRKMRLIEMMFLKKTANNAEASEILAVKTEMERVAEDFIKKIKKDKKNRAVYPFLKTLKLDEIRLNYIENNSINLFGALLSFNYDLPFSYELEDGRFTNDVLS